MGSLENHYENHQPTRLGKMWRVALKGSRENVPKRVVIHWLKGWLGIGLVTFGSL